MISRVIKVALKDILETKNKSLYALAKETDISYNALWKISNNKVHGITFDVLEKICKNLGCTPAQLLIFDESPAIQK
jgi:putative transcriptional regulator